MIYTKLFNQHHLNQTGFFESYGSEIKIGEHTTKNFDLFRLIRGLKRPKKGQMRQPDIFQTPLKWDFVVLDHAPRYETKPVALMVRFFTTEITFGSFLLLSGLIEFYLCCVQNDIHLKLYYFSLCSGKKFFRLWL